jgi:hypothetical protein
VTSARTLRQHLLTKKEVADANVQIEPPTGVGEPRRRGLAVLIVAFALSVTYAPVVRAGINVWTSTGPDGPG